MKKELLLKEIAETAYKVGFGAKKHFATYDIVEKVPGIIEFVSISIGILALVFEILNAKWLSAFLIIFGIVACYISKYDKEKDLYSEKGKELLLIFEELKSLYDTSKDKDDDFEKEEQKLDELQKTFHNTAMTKQILFSDTYAHYKFFWEYSSNIKWIEKELGLSLKNKIPFWIILFIVLLIISSIISLIILSIVLNYDTIKLFFQGL